MEFVVALGVALLFGLVMFPVVMLTRIGELSRELEEVRRQVAALAKKDGGGGEERPSGTRATPPPIPEVTVGVEVAPEAGTILTVARADDVEGAKSSHLPVPMPPPVVPAKPPILAAGVPVSATRAGAGAAARVRATVPAPATAAAPSRSANWEVFFGAKFLAWFGAVLAFLAVAYFLKYSIEHGLIPPTVRAAMGGVLGLGLIGGGLFAVRWKYSVLGHALCAAGLVSLYGVIYACRELYHFAFFGETVSLALMVLVTVCAFGLAVRLDGKFIAVLGLFGGFATPFLLPMDAERPLFLFGYIALLDAGLYAVAVWRRWNFLVMLGAVGTVCMEVFWSLKFNDFHSSNAPMYVCLGFVALFFAGFCGARWRQREGVPNVLGLAVLVGMSFLWAFAKDVVMEREPWLVLFFVFLADACLVAAAGLWRGRVDAGRFLAAASGLLLSVVLLRWHGLAFSSLTDAVPGLFAGCLVFALLHTVVPLLLEWKRAEEMSQRFANSLAKLDDLRLGVVRDLLPALLLLFSFAQIVWLEVGNFLDKGPAAANTTAVFPVALALVVLALGLTVFVRGKWLPVAALAGVVAVCGAWWWGVGERAVNSEALQPHGDIVAGIVWICGLFALFFAFPFVFWKRFAERRSAWFVSATSGVVLSPLVYRGVEVLWKNGEMGLVPAAFAVPALLALGGVWRFESPSAARTERLALYGGLALFFITLIFPIQLTNEWLTISWAIEGAILLWLWLRVPHRGLLRAGAGLLVAAFARLALNPAVLGYHLRGETPLLNWYLYTYGTVIACLFAGAHFLKKAGQEAGGFAAAARKVLPTLGVVLAFLLLNIEIADFFAEPGSRMLRSEVATTFAQDLSYTIAWALFALGLLVAGIWRQLPAPRYTALALLAVVSLKLFFHDLNHLKMLYRVGAFFGVAVVMIFASFLYQRFIAPRGGEAEMGK